MTETKNFYDEVPFERELMNPTLDALRLYGGSATTRQIRKYIIDTLQIRDEVARFRNGYTTELGERLAWVRTNLKRYGVLQNPSRGVWALTPLGRSVRSVDPHDVMQYVISQGKERPGNVSRSPRRREDSRSVNGELRDLLESLDVVLDDGRTAAGSLPEQDSWKDTLLTSLLAMSPNAFEHLMKRVMLQYDNTMELDVTGRTESDGGFYGFVAMEFDDDDMQGRFAVPFQVKRYRGNVNVNVVKEFRSRMTENDYTGVILTTGGFAQTARREAASGTTRIVLVDGDTLMDKLCELGWGVSAGGEVVDVDTYYFDNYHLLY